MDFITLQDVNDEIVTCVQADVDDANMFLLNVAKKNGVNEAKIVTPPVYTVKRLGVVYALYVACVRNIGKDNLTSLDTESTRDDIYAQKAKLFKEEIEALQKSISAADFIDGNASAYAGTWTAVVRRA